MTELHEKLILQNEEITVQRDEIEQHRKQVELQKDEIEIKNKNITDSIVYASKIQNAILPKIEILNTVFPDNFVLFKPCDIVSGDFYFFKRINNFLIIAAADCTGHGVPGAFMSMIANSLLNEIVNEKKVYLPRKILTILDKNIANVLNQKESGNRDGMDVCLIRIEKIDNNSSKILFAGAKRDLYYYKESESKIIRLKGSRKSVGGIFTSRSKAVFGNQEIIINSKDILYLSTDGYIDQNDKNRMRFGTQRFMLILQEIAALPLEDQKDLLLQLLHRFQQSQKQRDDITIVGLKLNNL